jgi:hypothetical protein
VKDINAILALVIVMSSGAAVFVWCEPTAAAWLSDRLYARARALREARITYRRVFAEVMEERRVVS